MSAGERDRLPSADPVERYRAWLKSMREDLRQGYSRRVQPRAFLRRHTRLVDDTLRNLWRGADLPRHSALVATGGYGRGELFPYSDVDVLILLDEAIAPTSRNAVEHLVGQLWDIGLEIGHSVRSIAQCVELARSDITVATALLDARHIAGDRHLFTQLREACRRANDPWSFYEAKKLEQDQRYAKHQDTPYSLEPNLKESPGGLRDLHVIRWIAEVCGVAGGWRAMQRSGLLLQREAVELARQERRLHDLRIRLHFLAGRREDRIVFDLQTSLAQESGFTDSAERRAGEALMQTYYRTAKTVTQLNTILLQNFAQRLNPLPDAAPRVVNERFRIRGVLLETAHEHTFEQAPSALLESFLIMQQHRELQGMSAATLRALWRAHSRIDARFRRDPVNRLLFLHILQQPDGIVHEFRRMNQYDILGRYLPEFGRIVGQMQHDLFHVYTVDQHILMVLRNLRRFTMPEFAHEFPLCSQLMSGFDRHWLLYIAALYHDIAKGRGGDHSELGAVDARAFCERHGLDEEDTSLVEFLVSNHLTLSNVAQKQDVHDLEVVRHFARAMGSERRLTGLYLLTVADVRGTSPKVWNAWKAKLLEDLFRAARNVLAGNALAADVAVAEKQAEAARLVRLVALSDDVKERFWGQLDAPYFLRHDPGEIAWQTRALHHRVDTVEPVVRARLAPIGEGIQVMVYARDRSGLFARICGYFRRATFNIVEAKIYTTRHRYALDTFLVLGEETRDAHREMIRMIENDLTEVLRSSSPFPPVEAGRVSRRVRHFPVSPSVDLRPDERGDRHVLSVVASDRPGLLYAVASLLAEHGVEVHSAKINTLGDRAEDVFVLSGADLADSRTVLQLEQALLQRLRI